MKIISTPEVKMLRVLFTLSFTLTALISAGQISVACTSPTNTIYGLTGNGEIYPINTATAAVGAVVKNNSYPGAGPKSSNGLGYNNYNGRFYYFKRNIVGSTQEFVSFQPSTNTVTILAASPATADIHTGCVSFDGKGYYTIDVDGKLHYYDIVNNVWKTISTQLNDQNNNDVSAVIRVQNAGDMAIDGWGNIWLVTSSDANWGLYKIPFPMPVNPIAKLNVVRVIDPTAATPTGKSFAGIAFKPDGSIYMSTKNGNRLYLLLNTTYVLNFVGTLSVSDLGNDLTSCVFPVAVLPVSWISFTAVLDNFIVSLEWSVAEEQNKGFYVEYSQDGKNWKQLAFLPSTARDGGVGHYSYSHTNNLSGVQYYRILQVDRNGTTSYSAIRSVESSSNKIGINLWPNPATETVNIVTKGGVNNLSRAQVFDVSGRKLMEKQLQSEMNQLNISHLPKGTYLVRVTDNKGIAYNQQIVKQ